MGRVANAYGRESQGALQRSFITGIALLGALIASLVLLLALSSAPALATEAHLRTAEFSVGGRPGGLAVEESTGNVLVLEEGNIQKFMPSGTPVEFTSTKTNEISGVGQGGFAESELAVDNSSGPAKGDIYVANNSEIRIYGADGKFLEKLNGGEPTPEWGETCGVAVDSSGNVYTGNYPGVVNKYTPVTNPVTNANFSGELSGVNSVCQVAVDSFGDPFVVTWSSGPITKFLASEIDSPGSLGGERFANGGTGAMISQSSNDLYTASEGHLAQYNPAGELLEEFGANEVNNGPVAVNSTNEFVFAGHNSSVAVFTIQTLPDLVTESATNITSSSMKLHGTVNPLGKDTTCKVEYGPTAKYGSEIPCTPADVGSAANSVETVTAELTGLEPHETYHYRFVATTSLGVKKGIDHSAKTEPVHAAPSLDSESTLSVGITSASLKAEINPNYWPTSYHFEYGTSTAYGTSVPLPDSSIGAGSTDVGAVWTLLGLSPATTYHFRVVATSLYGSVTGPDQVFTTFPPQTTSTGACPNANFRSEQRSYYLPDCRAYELVSPADKGSSNVGTQTTRDRASINGDAFSFYTSVGFGNPIGSEVPGAEYMSQREADGWSTAPINPAQASPADPGLSSEYVYETPDLSEGVFYALSPVTSEGSNVTEVENLYARKDLLAGGLGQYELLTNSIVPQKYTEPIFSDLGVAFDGASENLSHVAFESPNDLTENTQGLSKNNPKAYEWSNGEVHYVGILPDGSVAKESIVGKGGGGGKGVDDSPKYLYNAISADGSRIFFEAGKIREDQNAPYYQSKYIGNLYAREDGKTIQINESERTVPDNAEPESAEFQAATPDGSKVFFSSHQPLTNNSGPAGWRELYMYDFKAPAGERLTLITVPVAGDCGCEGPAIFNVVAGLSESGEYVYFTSKEPMVEGQEPFREEWIYVWHNGTIRAITGHVGGGFGAAEPQWPSPNTFRVARDGEEAVFEDGVISAFEAAGANPGQRPPFESEVESQYTDVFVYDYAKNNIVCASCKPAGDAPGGSASFIENADLAGLGTNTQYLNHPVSSNGEYVFFESPDSLLPQATNGRSNVYEYNTVSQRLYLLSSGTCACNSYFVDASPDGSNVFITTRDKLVSSDIDTNADVYDVRIEGGIESQNIPAPVACTGDACAGPAEHVPNFSIAASATFNGVGNPLPSLNPNQTETIAETNSQKLAKALKACKKKKNKKKRTKCEKQAKLQFGSKKPAKHAAKHAVKKSAKHASHRAGR